MHVFQTIEPLRSYLDKQRTNGVKIGLVPTMGALHEGHAVLLKKSVEENALTVCSIFVNPTQFNDPEDLSRYPQTPEQDIRLLEKQGCQVVFIPAAEEMYSTEPSLKMDFGYLSGIMEGAFRPGHFNGVGLVVAKLLNIIQPDNAYFGQKDYQQFLIIKQLAKDLSFRSNIIPVATVREADGLAFSSRNVNLSEADRKVAPVLYKVLKKAGKELNDGMGPSDVREMVNRYCHDAGIRLEYFEIAYAGSLLPVVELDHEVEIILCIAAKVGSVRLIDNVLLNDIQ